MKSNFSNRIKVSQHKKAKFNDITELINAIRLMPNNSTIAILASSQKLAFEWCGDAILTLAKSSGEVANYVRKHESINLSNGRIIVFCGYKNMDKLMGLKVYNAVIVEPSEFEAGETKYNLRPLMIELGLESEN